MSLIPIKFPPGIYRQGTEYQSKGRWYDCNLVRFYQDTIQPLGGWRKKTTSTVTGAGRAIISWIDNSSTTWGAIGTESHLYAMTRSGVLWDITPSGYTAGRADAVSGGGYGSGLYGAGTYGTATSDNSLVQAATMWSLDTWGEYLIGCTADDRVVYQWELDTGTVAAAVSNAPSALALIATEERILMALGAEENQRRVKWSDQEDNTDWTPTATNQAGDFDLQTSGHLMQGLRIKGGNLLFTDLDIWLAAYTADELVYSFNKVGEGCGAISRACAAALDAQAVWMGRSGFWLYNGFVAPLPCDVWDYVFSDMNLQQISKITCEMNSEFGEVTWHYPSAGSIEIDRFVTWNFRENHWSIGSLARLSGVDRGVMQYPLRVGTDGYVYEHEVGFSYDGATPYLESGPMEIGFGDAILYAKSLLPDGLTAGDVNATFKVKFEPDGSETSFGPYSLSARTDIRFSGRQVKVRYEGVALSNWRIGIPRIDMIPGGMR